MQNGWKTLIAPLGTLPSRFAWRFFGLVVVELLLVVAVSEDHGPAGRVPLSFVALATSGLVLLFAGPRLLTLAFTGAAGSLVLVQIIEGRPAYQLAEEYLVIALLPTLAIGLATWALLRPGRPQATALQAEINASWIGLFRVTTVWMMLFAALHKVNSDFFDPQVSCATVHAERFLVLMGAGPQIAGMVPFLAILAELAVPVLLIVAPRLALPIVIFIMTYIGHRGATPFTQLVMMLACTFLTEEDLRTMLEGVRRRWIGLAVLFVLITVGSALVLSAADWARYFLWFVATASLGYASALLLLTRWTEAWGARGSGGLGATLAREFGRSRLLPTEKVARVLVFTIGLAIAANALTPYLGTKFRLSFAMFSNLRVDDARWNSSIFPRALDRTETDPYLHVSRSGGPDPKVDGLYSRKGLETLLARIQRSRAKVDLEIRHRGVTRSFENAGANPALVGWLDTLPQNRLIHERLSASTPQRCLH